MSEELTIERIREMRAGPTPAIYHAGETIDFLLAKLDEMRAALEHIALLCGTESEEEFRHTLMVDIPETCRAALAQHHGTEEKR